MVKGPERYTRQRERSWNRTSKFILVLSHIEIVQFIDLTVLAIDLTLCVCAFLFYLVAEKDFHMNYSVLNICSCYFDSFRF